MKKRIKFIAVLSLLFVLIFALTTSAVTEEDVETAVKSSSKENVSGNVFVWFLCAIAFMKVSQKIDSFIASLGISVGRTGGSMMAEAMIAGRAISGALRVGKGVTGFGRGGTGGRDGFFGGIGRKFSGGAASVVTGKGASGGLIGSLGSKAYEGSLGKGGSFATGIISSVARGDISKMGTISGDKGKAAMESYFGYNTKTNNSLSSNAEVKNLSSPSFNQGGATSIISENNSANVVAVDNPSFDGGSVPMFSDVEMGGGRITGIETTPDFPEGRQFAMYDAEKYSKPDGNFETVKAVDKSTWYKQYAQPSIERTPYMEKGKVQYNEKIVNKLPKTPSRKDKI